MSIDFSVLDVETTGLFPEHNDRVVEIAVVRVDTSGSVIDHYTTLVNPDRDLGPTHIHGISASDVKGAPVFADIAGDVFNRLGGTVISGYYPTFDFRFLRSEMLRIGCQIPSAHLLAVNELARAVDPNLPGRKLEVCCRHFGVVLAGAHSAYCDATATAKLLFACINRDKKISSTYLERVQAQPFPPKNQVCPELPILGKSLTRIQAIGSTRSAGTYIERLVESLPRRADGDPKLDEYLALLDRVLEDRVVTVEEANLLLSEALELGISGEGAREAHLVYMRDLIALATADGVITRSEERDLRSVGDLLAIPKGKLEEMIQEATREVSRAANPVARRPREGRDFTGTTICFTGEMTCRIKGNLASRSVAEAIAADHGMVVKNSVTKGLDYLVVPDPNSMSGKAKKVRRYGVRLVAEPVFWQWMEVDVE